MIVKDTEKYLARLLVLCLANDSYFTKSHMNLMMLKKLKDLSIFERTRYIHDKNAPYSLC